jgi:hypothetical protein
MSDEKQEFMDRLVKWESDCWEFRKPDGTRYPSNASPLWKDGEAFRHAAVRLLGGFLGPVKRGWFVKSRKTCVRFCVNPLHLTVKPNGRYPESRPERILEQASPIRAGRGAGTALRAGSAGAADADRRGQVPRSPPEGEPTGIRRGWPSRSAAPAG